MPDLGGSRGLVASLAIIRGKYGTTDYLAGTAAGGKDHHRVSAAERHRRGLQLLCVDTGGWICIAYADDDPVDCAPHHYHVLTRQVQLRVRRRVVQDRAMGGRV